MPTPSLIPLEDLLALPTDQVDSIRTQAVGPSGELPLTDEILREWSSGDLFGLTQNAGMGWSPQELLGPQ